MDVLGSVNAAIALAQRLREVGKNVENAEFTNVLADLNLELANTKLALAQITSEYAAVQEELTQLKHSRGSEAELVFKDFAYFTTDGDGPFCPGCYDSKGIRIRLAKYSGAFTAFGSHNCPSCSKNFGPAT